MSESTPRSLALVTCRICKENFGEFLTLDSAVQVAATERCCNRRLLDLFNEVTRLGAQVDDMLPQMVCQQCVQQLQHMSEFLQKAQRAEKEFRQAVLLLHEDEHRNSTVQHTIVSKKDGAEGIAAAAEDKEMICVGVADPLLDKTETLPENEINDQIEHDAVGEGEDHQDSYESFAALDSCYSECYSEVDKEEEVSHTEHTKERIEIKRIASTPRQSPQKDTGNPASSHIDKCQKKKRAKSKNFECATCHKRFQTAQKLQQHQLVHTRAKNYACPLCDKSFATVYRQRDHLKTHSDERNFSCDICDKRFLLHAHLKSHLLTHTDRRPHRCAVCGISFLQSSVLKTHMALHEGKTAECNVCQRKFSRPAHLKVHQRLHSGDRPYKCSHCDSAYMQKSHLDRHLGTHLGIRFTCEHCAKVYTKKSTLDTHMRQEHLRNRIYTCRICTLDFSKQKSYYYHMKTKHPKDEQTNAEMKNSASLV